MWDRVTGGTTVVMHVDGSFPPGTPRVAENVKVHVYAMPSLLQELPDTQRALAQLVQSFVESMAIPVITRWERAAANENWNLNTMVPASSHSRSTAIRIRPLIPRTTGTAHFEFWGRRPGELARLIRGLEPQEDTQPPAVSSHLPHQYTSKINSLQQKVQSLEKAIDEHDERFAALQAEYNALREEKAALKLKIELLEQEQQSEIEEIEAVLRATMDENEALFKQLVARQG